MSHSHADTATWATRVHAAFKDAGLKHGEARERVVQLLAREPCALTANEIADRLRVEGHPTGLASVYRTLDLLAEHGLVERVEVGDGQARFERLAPGGEHHHHLVCDSCGKLIAFDDPGLERAIDRLSDRLGVRIASHDVLLRGACGDCD